jgi:hypothetical protein
VRRVEPNRAAFWAATSEPSTVTATVWSGQQTSTGAGRVQSGDAVAATGTASTKPFGARLHLATVVAEATTVLPPGQLFAYDLSFQGQGEPQGLRDLGLLKDEVEADRATSRVDPNAPLQIALGYALDRLPTFVTAPAALEHLILAQASCRKTNGEGPDAMAYFDEEIQENLSDPLARPHQLFLTGDQIYADEVGTALLPMLAGLAADLVGFTERLPLGANEVDATIANLPALRRERVVRELARFTTTSGENHLLTFGEFAAMYLCAWSPRVWRALADADGAFVPASGVETNHLTNWEACFDGQTSKWKEAKAQPFAEEKRRVEVFRAAVPRVARALANVATYMIFDDHEVTDDWYLSKRWRSRVLTAPLGRAIMRSALGAYTVFQGWGNDPAAFTHSGAAPPSDNENLLTAVQDAMASGPSLSTAVRDRFDTLLGLTEPLKDPKVVFHYSVPGPLHLVRVLDTRTRLATWARATARPAWWDRPWTPRCPRVPSPTGASCWSWCPPHRSCSLACSTPSYSPWPLGSSTSSSTCVAPPKRSSTRAGRARPSSAVRTTTSRDGPATNRTSRPSCAGPPPTRGW